MYRYNPSFLSFHECFDLIYFIFFLSFQFSSLFILISCYHSLFQYLTEKIFNYCNYLWIFPANCFSFFPIFPSFLLSYLLSFPFLFLLSPLHSMVIVLTHNGIKDMCKFHHCPTIFVEKRPFQLLNLLCPFNEFFFDCI